GLAGEILPGAEAGHDVEVAGDEDGDLDQIVDGGASGVEAELEVAQGLGGLGAEIAIDEPALGIDGVLAADQHEAAAGGDDECLGESRILVHTPGFEEVDG